MRWLHRAWITIPIYVYFACLLSWFLLHTFFGDRWWWLFLLSSLVMYQFLILPAILGVALVVQQRDIWVSLGMATLLWLYLYGGLLVPSSGQLPTSTLTIRVMSFNMLSANGHPERVVRVIREANVDVVALQELNIPTAQALQHKLQAEFPYQILDPLPQGTVGNSGMGVLSRYPLHLTNITLAGDWLGGPQILELDVHGRRTMLVNFHAAMVSERGIDNLWRLPEGIEISLRKREQQAQILAHFAATHPYPLVAAGDLNASDQSTAYSIITAVLDDAWREAGWGFGHTFPGAASSGSSRPALWGIYAPMWLVRIDYIFSSHHWQVSSARIGPWDDVSDHRPVIAQLGLSKAKH